MKIPALKSMLIAGFSILVLGVLAAAAIVLQPWQLIAIRRQAQTQHVFALNLNEAAIPFHSTAQVPASISSNVGIERVELWINSQLWAEEEIDPPQNEVQLNWDWTPSGEGQHELVLRYQELDGQFYSSNPIHVYALASLDVHFPVEYNPSEGETAVGIATRFGIPPQMLLDSNPDLGLSADLPLDPGVTLQIPLPIPNQPPASPLGGEAPAPPAVPLDQIAPVSQAAPSPGENLTAANLPPEALMPGFHITNGKLQTPVPVDRLYLYYRLAAGAWRRGPTDPQAFFQPGPGGLFDVSLDLDLEALQDLPEPVALDIEAWGWKGDNLIFLGLYHDLVGGPLGSLTWPPQETQLKAFEYEQLGKSIFSTSINISGNQPTLTRSFEWQSTAPDTTYIIWQVSTLPYDNPEVSSHILHSGNRPGSAGEFSLNFRDYFKTDGGESSGGNFWNGLSEAIEEIKNLLTGTSAPVKSVLPFLPNTFYVRVIPMTPNGAAGDPSNTVMVHFTPAGIPVETTGPLEGPVYDVQILEFIPYRAADPAYSACFVTNVDFKQCTTSTGEVKFDSFEDLFTGNVTIENNQQCTTLVPKGALSCGCPGLTCESEDEGCGYNPFCYLGKGAEALGSALKAGYDWLAENYNDAVAFVKEMAAKLNPLCIQAKLAAGAVGGETVTEGDVEAVCKAVADIAVTAVMAYFGLPPSLPEYDKLAEEGLDYAIGVATSEMGFECNKECRDLIKKGFKSVTSGENLLQAGLEMGADVAAKELEEIGIDCDQKCKQLITDGVQGKASTNQLTDVALDQATDQIVKSLNENNYSCGQECESRIRQALEQGKAIGDFASSSAGAGKQPEPFYVPHPLATEQQALLRVEIFRRWESAAVPAEDVSKCNLGIYNQATNTNFSDPVQGKLFSNEGIELPVLEPGDSMVIPVVFERVPWFMPEGVTMLVEPSPGGAISAALIDPVYGSWINFYHGAQLSINVTGPQFLTLDGQGGTVSLPCVSGDGLKISIPPMP